MTMSFEHFRMIKPTLITMPMSVPAVAVLLFLAASVCLSDGASVSKIKQNGEYSPSKIIMDHSSTPIKLKMAPSAGYDQRRVDKVGEFAKGLDGLGKTFPTPSTLNSKGFLPKLNTKPEKNLYDVSSPLHVAQCRATCLHKFSIEDATKREPTSTLPTTLAITTSNATTLAGEMHLEPILRLRRKRSSSAALNNFANNKSSWSCFHNSSQCFTCWKSCENLESGNIHQEKVSSSPLPTEEPREVDEGTTIQKLPDDSDQLEMKNGKKQSKQSTASTCSNQCQDGCQVACTFYKGLLTKNGRNEQYHEGTLQKAFLSDPVIATKQESVVRVVPGKITWLARTSNDIKEVSLSSPIPVPEPVVYVVIQEYPDRKWRQIVQTTEAEVEIPKELTSAMRTKLRSVRVLAVGPNGLLSVYSPEIAGKILTNNIYSVNASIDNAVTVIPTMNKTISENDDEAHESTVDATDPTKTSTDLILNSTDANIPLNASDDVAVTSTSAYSSSSVKSTSTVSTMPTVATVNNTLSEAREPFQLRRVSLIHQKSLVIAELVWNQIGNKVDQEYLITWELTGGGLKGHLVTDSTSVTLSLWPDTQYRIQVELFEQSMETDVEQPIESSMISLKSLPLTLDTSEASFPMESPSALLSSSYQDEDPEEDDSEGGNEREEEEALAHKSITGFFHMTLVIGIPIVALIFVLVVLSLAAFSWMKMRALNGNCTQTTNTRKAGCHTEKGGCCSGGCFSYSSFSSNEPRLLVSQEDFWEDSSTILYPSSNSYSLDFEKSHCNENLPSNLMPYSFGTSQDEGQESVKPTTVAVISASSSSSRSLEDGVGSSFLNYYPNDYSAQSSSLASSLGKVDFPIVESSSETGVIKAGEQGCPSSSYWLPKATCATTNNTSHLVPVTTSTRRTSTPETYNIQQLQQEHHRYLHHIINNNNSNNPKLY